MQNDHFVEEDAGFRLTAVDHHALLEDCGTVVLASARRIARSLALAHLACVSVELEQLVSALSHLSLRAVHEAAAEDVDFSIKTACCMALSADNRL